MEPMTSKKNQSTFEGLVRLKPNAMSFFIWDTRASHDHLSLFKAYKHTQGCCLAAEQGFMNSSMQQKQQNPICLDS